MSDEACRTRSQKRAIGLDVPCNDVDIKKIKMEKGLALKTEDDLGIKAEDGTGRVSGVLRGGDENSAMKADLLSGDGPVDMTSTKSEIKEKRAMSPDVIVLSDNEPSSPRMNGLIKIPPSVTNSETLLLMQNRSPEEREKMIKQLKEELRLEEAKLVLLKKLRQSQIQKETNTQKPAGSSASLVATPPPLVRGTQNIPPVKPSSLQIPTRVPGTVIPPPLVRGGQQISSKLGSQQNTQIVMPPLVRGAQQPISVSPQQVHSIRQHSSTGPPPLLLAPRASVPSVQIQGQRIIQQGLIRVANVPNTSLIVNIPQASPNSVKGTTATSSNVTTAISSIVNSNYSPASRQAADKLALRKQLEKTLLEIPPPKPPAPELNFLPSAANNEFIYLVGLEEVVQNLLETQGKVLAASSSHEPYCCAQCKTDFTSRWREETNGTIMCDSCMTSNQKKALKAEHTNRLKAAFVKALQQEQEIEQRILQQTAASVQAKQESILQHHALKQVRTTPNQISRVPQGTHRGVLHAFSQSPKLHQTATAALINRPDKHGERPVNRSNMTANSWKKSQINPGGTLSFVSPGLTVHKSSSAVDRQREYLLDMIPPRSITQSATWK